eukprot:CAMPEP_0118878746 /NCGR_PEP_ID=MMETSP1163-20130328/18649_1 /TAXON_ID=124430 /ORGANISM="Phaeomonas parva, Strain CCMP2877" /LENGTH=41 /DNA_ID= /DNA_START= /DNA_END= /DNA_ORIENTATION=
MSPPPGEPLPYTWGWGGEGRLGSNDGYQRLQPTPMGRSRGL